MFAVQEDTLMNQLTASQRTTGELIESLIRNFKKDSASRKTLSYYEERLRRLDIAWGEFETVDNKIRCLENPQLDHKYFTENYYKKISDLTQKYREIFEAAIMETSKPVTDNSNNQQGAIEKPTSTNSAIKRQNVMMSSLRRLLNMDPTATNMRLKEKLWEQI